MNYLCVSKINIINFNSKIQIQYYSVSFNNFQFIAKIKIYSRVFEEVEKIVTSIIRRYLVNKKNFSTKKEEEVNLIILLSEIWINKYLIF